METSAPLAAESSAKDGRNAKGQFVKGHKHGPRKGESPNPDGQKPLITEARNLCAEAKDFLLHCYGRTALRPVTSQSLIEHFEHITGLKVDPDNPPTYAEMMVEAQFFLAARSQKGYLQAKEIRRVLEGPKGGTPLTIRFDVSTLPPTNAVTGGRRGD